MNSLINVMAKSRLFNSDLDYHLVRASMVIIYLLFGYTYCISSNHSAIVLSYQWLPTIIPCGEAMARRRKEDAGVGSVSRGMVRRLGRFFSRVRPRVS